MTTGPRLPPTNGNLDYQLGGSYAPAKGVQVVSRDRTAKPANGLYNICYVNGFQVQPGEEQNWDAELFLHDSQGKLVIDTDWNEVVLDISTEDKRTRIAQVVNAWIRQCAVDGFDAVEVDNLDTYSRFKGLKASDAVALVALYAQAAHQNGLAIGQKNAAELAARKADMGTDFVVAEECNSYDECETYTAVYAGYVLMIEYEADAFAKGCQQFGASYGIVLRDVDLRPVGQSGYLYQGC
jgi:hypothetical protein